MNTQDRANLRYDLTGGLTDEFPFLNKCVKLIDQYGELVKKLLEIEQVTLVINDGERLRQEVRKLAADAIKEYVLQ